jgi:hypothetical protein
MNSNSGNASVNSVWKESPFKSVFLREQALWIPAQVRFLTHVILYSPNCHSHHWVNLKLEKMSVNLKPTYVIRGRSQYSKISWFYLFNDCNASHPGGSWYPPRPLLTPGENSDVLSLYIYIFLFLATHFTGTISYAVLYVHVIICCLLIQYLLHNKYKFINLCQQPAWNCSLGDIISLPWIT